MPKYTHLAIYYIFHTLTPSFFFLPFTIKGTCTHTINVALPYTHSGVERQSCHDLGDCSSEWQLAVLKPEYQLHGCQCCKSSASLPDSSVSFSSHSSSSKGTWPIISLQWSYTSSHTSHLVTTATGSDLCWHHSYVETVTVNS